MDFLKYFQEKREKNRIQIRSEKNKSLFNSFRKTTISFIKPDTRQDFNSLIQIQDLKMAIFFDNNENIEKVLFSIRDGLLSFCDDENGNRLDFSQIINDGLLNVLSEILENKNRKMSQEVLELSLWIISIIAAGSLENCQLILNLGLIENLLGFIKLRKFREMRYSFITLGNMAVFPEIRSYILSLEVVKEMLELFQEEEILNSNKDIKAMLFFVKNMSVHDANYDCYNLNYLISTVASLMDLEDESIFDVCLTILALMGQNTNDFYITELIKNQYFIENLIKSVNSENIEHIIKSLNIIANLSLGNNEQTIQLAKHKILDYVKEYFDSPNPLLKKTSIIIFGNFLDGDTNHFTYCYEFGILKKLLNTLKSEGDPEMQKEILQCFVNSTFSADLSQITQLVEMDLICVFFRFLIELAHDTLFMIEILSGIDNILKVYNDPQINDVDLIQNIKWMTNLQNHENDNVRFFSWKIGQKFVNCVN